VEIKARPIEMGMGKSSWSFI